MGRLLYICLIGLHPRHFRERFGEEMLGIFDETEGNGWRAALLLDVLVSLFRQWVLRPAHGEFVRSTVVAGQSPDQFLFHILDNSLPRRAALINGAALSLVFFAALTFFISRGAGGSLGRAVVYTGPTPAQSFGANGSAVWQGELPTANPLNPFAKAYFRMIRVLDALDVNRDQVISPSEIIAAPAALVNLDRDHDGKLSPEECGFYLGENPMANLEPQLVERARLEFMRLNPVLAALDVDRDGEISAREIKNSSATLRTLDKNRDGSLTPDELLPGPLVGFTVDEIIKRQ